MSRLDNGCAHKWVGVKKTPRQECVKCGAVRDRPKKKRTDHRDHQPPVDSYTSKEMVRYVGLALVAAIVAGSPGLPDAISSWILELIR